MALQLLPFWALVSGLLLIDPSLSEQRKLVLLLPQWLLVLPSALALAQVPLRAPRQLRLPQALLEVLLLPPLQQQVRCCQPGQRSGQQRPRWAQLLLLLLPAELPRASLLRALRRAGLPLCSDSALLLHPLLLSWLRLLGWHLHQCSLLLLLPWMQGHSQK